MHELKLEGEGGALPDIQKTAARETTQAVPSGFSVLRHPINHLLLAGANNRNVAINYRFFTAPVQANRDFFWHTDCTFQL